MGNMFEKDAAGFGTAEVFALLLQWAERVDEKLGDVSEGESVAAGDAAARQLAEEIGEEAVHGSSVRKAGNSAKKIARDGFAIRQRSFGGCLSGVIGTEERLVFPGGAFLSRQGKHPAAMAPGIDVLAGTVNRAQFSGHGDTSVLEIEEKKASKVVWREGGPPWFFGTI